MGCPYRSCTAESEGEGAGDASPGRSLCAYARTDTERAQRAVLCRRAGGGAKQGAFDSLIRPVGGVLPVRACICDITGAYCTESTYMDAQTLARTHTHTNTHHRLICEGYGDRILPLPSFTVSYYQILSDE